MLWVLTGSITTSRVRTELTVEQQVVMAGTTPVAWLPPTVMGHLLSTRILHNNRYIHLMYMYMYIRVGIYMYACTFYVHAHVHTCMCRYIHVCMYI